jgi:hypothetical protein
MESEQNQFLLYTAPDGAVKVEVFHKDETVWLTQKALAELFGVQRPAVTKHLQNIFTSGELAEDSVCSILEHTAADGKTYSAKYYNLDAIIAVGYRVNSYQATQFRIWATKTLREFIVKGFVLDDERLKQGKRVFGKDYFDELLERIREIRASERRFYQKITDIYALSVDYSADAPVTKEFFATVQNKLRRQIRGLSQKETIEHGTREPSERFRQRVCRPQPGAGSLCAAADAARGGHDHQRLDGHRPGLRPARCGL